MRRPLVVLALPLLLLAAPSRAAGPSDYPSNDPSVQAEEQSRREVMQRRKNWPKSHEASLEAIRLSLKLGALRWCEDHVDDAEKRKTYSGARKHGEERAKKAVEKGKLTQRDVETWGALAKKSGGYEGPLDEAQCDRLAGEVGAPGS